MSDTLHTPVLAECGSYDSEAVGNALKRALIDTGALDFVKPGMKIAIKLNLCAAKKPETAATTHPVPVTELVKLLRERGACVIVGDSPGEPFTKPQLTHTYNTCGLKMCEEAGAELNFDTGFSEVDGGGVTLHSFAYCDWLAKCDCIINFCKLKAHGLMGMTAAAKNLYGVIPGTIKSEYHFLHRDPADFANMLVDINEFVKPVLHIVDAVEVMEGNGPTQGTPRHLGLIIAGKNQYEIDRLCATILGLSENEIPYLTAAKKRGLLSQAGTDAYRETAKPYVFEEFTRSGATSSWFINDPKDPLVKKILKKGLYVLLRSKPVVTDSCTACGHCVKGCPADAITIKNGKAYIKRSKCVRCFCCQEFCPTGAMRVKRSAIARLVEH
ncbi:MAG: DUF362 domain-containing protein [Lachnospiraceae bacterium]|nr:DUF362 domain-containing protein [Lachnospiraceae bacterium]